MTRKTHLVGAWPGFSGAHAMDVAMRRLGPHLLRMTDGETGERSQWIQPTLEWLRANPDVELVQDGDHTGYEDGTRYRVRDGRAIDPHKIELGYHRAFQRSYPAFCELRGRHGLSGLSFQVGIPAPIDLAVIAFGDGTGRHDESVAPAFVEASGREIDAIRSEAGDDVIFQLESVVAMVAVARSDPGAQRATAARMASALAETVARAPLGTRFGAHLCLGDYHHRALTEMGSAQPLVTMANALAAAWPADRGLEYIHTPFAAAERPGSLEESWYEPLSGLEVPAAVRFVAGFVHEDLGLDELRRVHRMIEEHAGRQVDVAATCGLGRRPSVDQAWDAMDKTLSLLGEASNTPG